MGVRVNTVLNITLMSVGVRYPQLIVPFNIPRCHFVPCETFVDMFFRNGNLIT